MEQYQLTLKFSKRSLENLLCLLLICLLIVAVSLYCVFLPHWALSSEQDFILFISGSIGAILLMTFCMFKLAKNNAKLKKIRCSFPLLPTLLVVGARILAVSIALSAEAPAEILLKSISIVMYPAAAGILLCAGIWFFTS